MHSDVMHSGYVNPIEKTIKRPNHSRLDLVVCSDGNNCVLRLLLHLMTFFVICFILDDDTDSSPSKQGRQKRH